MTSNPDGEREFSEAELEAIGRRFRALPPEEQIEDLATALMQAERQRDEVAAVLVGAPSDDPRQPLLADLNRLVEGFRARIAEVRDQRPN